MKNTYFLKITFLLTALFSMSKAHADGAKDFGFTVGILTPTPGGFGAGINYDITHNMRIGFSFGTMIMLTTYGLNFKYLFLEGAQIRPFLGAQFNSTHIIDVVSGLFQQEGQDQDKTHGNFDAGVDYKMEDGFNAGIAVSWLAKDSPITNKVLPYVYLGWYF